MTNIFDPCQSLIPIFHETTIPKGIKQIATSVFIKNDMGYFLFTAAHVTDDLKTGNILVPVNGYFEKIHGYISYIDLPREISRDKDNIDCAYFKLSTPFARELFNDFKPLILENCELINSSLKLKLCSVAGYPASKVRKKENVFSSEIYVFSGVAAEESIYSSLNVSHSSNIIVHFNRKNSKDFENGKPFMPPSLKGVSGGGIFTWSDNSVEWSERKLVGIFHTYKEKQGLIIGTTLIPFLSALTLGHMKGFGGYY